MQKERGEEETADKKVCDSVSQSHVRKNKYRKIRKQEETAAGFGRLFFSVLGLSAEKNKKLVCRQFFSAFFQGTIDEVQKKRGEKHECGIVGRNSRGRNRGI